MSAPARTPRQAFEALIDHITARRWKEIPDLYAEDARVEIPFDLPAPTTITGREALRRRFTGASAAGQDIELQAHNVRVHETADPEVIVAEFDYRGRVPSTGRSFDVANIQVLTVRDGLIVATRDFHDHLALAAAGGQLPAVLAALDSASTASTPER
ncbi:nuclear transport factor 2 family protein [Streptacidiphilus carbonis]|jgi:uncharacterized protein|uniref:nuclear transport factor 2 family protein n=1 Tax=Streptacidiphilus carbonis TaxID=105422 RepID=UPI0005A98003|nr:nuclear transport factor 2 family protein [Streptacidiphilus carbonis]